MLHQTFFLLSALIAVACAGVELAFVLTSQRRGWKKPLRLFAGVALLYVGAIYFHLLHGVQHYLYESGLLASVGIIITTLLLAAEVIADWRQDK